MASKFPQKMNFDSLIFRSDFHKYRKVFRALFARLLLMAHCCFSVYLVAKIDTRYYGIYAPYLFFFLVETAAILYFRWGCEWKRVCTCFCVYLFTMIPVLWILRLHEIDQSKTGGNATQVNQSLPLQAGAKDNPIFDALVSDEKEASTFANYFKKAASSLLEQWMMILIILCRWFLPRGRIDRNSLTQLLIMYSGISADILDFSEIFDEKEITSSGGFRFVVLGVWSWSLMQFIPVITTSFHFRRHQTSSRQNNRDTETDDNSEVLSILMVLFMQDGPFLLIRIYSVFVLRVFDYLIVFFALKNFITVSLGCYRALILCGCCSKEGDDLLRKSEIARSMESLDAISFSSMQTSNSKKKNSNKKGVKFSNTNECDSKTNKNKKGKKERF